MGFRAGVFAVEDLAGLVARAAELAELSVVAIDMPIGLPDQGQREADWRARKAVGPRWQSVFLTPTRAALAEDSYPAATRINEGLGGGISTQAYALRPRILELDAYVHNPAVPVIEVHPEVSFAALAGEYLPYPKKCWAGMVLRRDLLTSAGITVADDLGPPGVQAAVNAVLDAAVAAWSARRHTAGQTICYPYPPQIFSDGHHAAIRA